MSGMDRLTEREWLISLLTIEQEQMLTDYGVHPDAWEGDSERTDCIAALADGILDGLAHRRASQAAPAPSAHAISKESAERMLPLDEGVTPSAGAPAPYDVLREAWIAGRDAAKKVAGTFCWNRCVEGGKLKSPAVFTTHTWQRIQEAIDAECPVPDDLTASPAQEGGE